MQQLEDADQTLPRNVQEAIQPNHTEVPSKDTQETETKTDNKKEANLPQVRGRFIHTFFSTIFTEKWVTLIRSYLGATTYLAIVWVMTVLVERVIFTVVIWIFSSESQMVLTLTQIAQVTTIIMYVFYSFVVAIIQIRHFLDVFSL